MGFQNTSWSCKGHHMPISELALFWAESLVAVCTLLKKPRNRANLQTGFVISFPHNIVARPFFATIKVVFVFGTTARYGPIQISPEAKFGQL